MWNSRTVEILIWVNAASRESVITGFAQAANTVDASQPDEGAETAAARFVSWLAHTRRPWALVIDDLAELSDLEELWPSGASGRVLITTRLPADAFEDAAAEGGARPREDLRVVPVPGLNRREALDYVTSRLTDYPDQRIEALDLGEDLDGLPLALAQATAAMSARRQGCREYRAQLAERIGTCPPCRARRPRCSPPGPSPRSARTNSRRPGWPGRRWCWPRCSITTACPAPC